MEVQLRQAARADKAKPSLRGEQPQGVLNPVLSQKAAHRHARQAGAENDRGVHRWGHQLPKKGRVVGD